VIPPRSTPPGAPPAAPGGRRGSAGARAARRVVVVGAAGRTGALLVQDALRSGHHVTAVVRRPSPLPRSADSRLSVRLADVLEPATLDGALVGADAVISALGAPPTRRRTTLFSEGCRHLAGEMRRSGVRRLVVISAIPVERAAGAGVLERRVAHPLLNSAFRATYDDLRRMEAQLAETRDLDWTVVRPPRLTGGPASGRVRVRVGAGLAGAWSISRRDLSRTVVDGLDDPEWNRSVVCVAGGSRRAARTRRGMSA
jgi:putative NADH-flavin reductase